MQKVSKSKKSNLQFPVGSVKRRLKERTKLRVSETAAVFLASTMEYMAAEVLELSGNEAKDHNKKIITAQHINLAIRGDEELNVLMGKGTVIAGGGVMPHIHEFLVPVNESTKSEGGDVGVQVNFCFYRIVCNVNP